MSDARGYKIKHTLTAAHAHITSLHTSTHLVRLQHWVSYDAQARLWVTETDGLKEEGKKKDVRESHITEMRPWEERKVGWRRRKSSGRGGERGTRSKELEERRREEEVMGGGCFLSPFLPAHIDSHRKSCSKRVTGRTAGHMTFSQSPSLLLSAEWCARTLPSRSLPLALPSSAHQSFDMSSSTTKTEVGRLAGATAASGCLALKLTANTAGRGGGGGVGGVERQREKDIKKEGKEEEGDGDRKLKRETWIEAACKTVCIKQGT